VRALLALILALTILALAARAFLGRFSMVT
jgi:hypothetical protein